MFENRVKICCLATRMKANPDNDINGIDLCNAIVVSN